MRRISASAWNWRFTLVCLATGLLAGTVSFLASVGSVRASGHDPIAPTLPFSAGIVLKQFWPPGTGKVAASTKWTYYRFTDGSYAERDTEVLLPEERPGIDKVVDLKLRQDLFMEPVTKSVITIRRAPGEQINVMNGAWEDNCPGDDDDVQSMEAGEMFFGFPTIHVVKNFGADWIEDRWMIRELRCFSVKEIDVSGPSKNEHLATSLVVGEPLRSVLSAPEGYVERSPTETVKAYALAKGGDPLFSGGLLKKLNADYERGKQLP
jgi:hypothetical protein